MALTKVSGHIIDQPFDVGIITATNQYVSGIGTFGNIRVLGDLQVDGTTTTLDTVVTEVDRLEVAANNNTVAIAVTQSGSGRGLSVDGDAVISNTGANPLDLYKYGTNAPSILMYGANGTAASPTQTQTGDAIGGWNAFGYGSSGWAGGPSVRITAIATENNGTTSNRGADIKYETVVNGGTSLQERMRLTNAGKLLVGSTITSNSAAIQGFSAHGNTAGESGVTSADTNAMAAGIGGEIAFYGKTDGTATPYNYLGHIRGIKENGTNANTACALTFYTRPTLTAPQERLRITSDGKVRVPDNGKFTAGAGDDLEIFHDGTNSFVTHTGPGQLFITNETSGQDVVLRADNGGSLATYLQLDSSAGEVKINHAGSLKLATKSTGISVTGNVAADGIRLGDDDKINLGDNDDLQISHDGATSIISGMYHPIEIRHQSEVHIKCVDDGTVELYHNNSKKLETTSGGVTVTGDVSVGDSSKVNFGASSDGRIYYNQSNDIFYIYNNSAAGGTIVQNNSAAGGITLQPVPNENAVFCAPNGRVSLYYNSTEKFRTTTTGAKVTGALEVTQEYPSIRPILDLNFAATKTLDRRITFTRDSIGTFTDENGLVKYASNNVPRFDHDPTTGESLGLLIEESRTNVLLFSEDEGNWLPGNAGTITTNSGIAPDGTNTASKISTTSSDLDIGPITSNVSGGNSYLSGLTGGATYTYSAYFKASTNAQVGNNFLIRMKRVSGDLVTASDNFELTSDWVRKSITFTLPANVDRIWTYVGGIVGSEALVWGAQVELGSFATSFIPTSGSTVTRAADIAKITGTNFTDFYNQSEGTIIAEYRVPPEKNDSAIWGITGASDADRITHYLRAASSGSFRFDTTVSSAFTSAIQITNPRPNVYKTGLGISPQNIKAIIDGGTLYEDTGRSGNIPTVTQLLIGNTTTTSTVSGLGHMSRLSYYNKRLPDAQLQGLTQ